MKPRELIDFLGVVEKLKCNTRHSWTSSNRQESVADHSFRLSLMALLLTEEFPDADMSKVIKMCLIHDLGEAVTGDIPSFNKTKEDEQIEDQAIKQLLHMLPSPENNMLTVLFKEMDEMQTVEARLYKALDKLEVMIQHNEADLSTWILLEYETNISYAAENVLFSEYLQKLREEVNRDSYKKIEKTTDVGIG
jgi:putative hydrolases of HD superfamily